VDDTGAVWCWGGDTSGQIGPITATSLPERVVDVPADVAWRVFAGYDRSCVARLGTTPYCWGENSNGSLGVGDLVDHPTPVSVSTETDVIQFAHGPRHSCWRSESGAVQCAGAGNVGQLGDGTMVDSRSSFAPISLAREWRRIAAGRDFTCALTAVGAVYCWGLNSAGQLGNGSRENSPEAVLVAFPALGPS
jgi:alpha-tubulin suppressor-like RCC1 family protein